MKMKASPTEVPSAPDEPAVAIELPTVPVELHMVLFVGGGGIPFMLPFMSAFPVPFITPVGIGNAIVVGSAALRAEASIRMREAVCIV
jgi:hypothetical protein